MRMTLKGFVMIVGDKFGFIKATIDFALNREDLREQVQEYLRELVK